VPIKAVAASMLCDDISGRVADRGPACALGPTTEYDDAQLSVIVPLHNEAENVLPLAESVFKAVGEHRWWDELVLVDDRSTDATWAGHSERA